jgi:hypothetical protein
MLLLHYALFAPAILEGAGDLVSLEADRSVPGRRPAVRWETRKSKMRPEAHIEKPPRENQRAGSVLALPARAISTKNKHLLVIYSIPTRGFTAAVSVFRAHLLQSPLIVNVKSGAGTPAHFFGIDGQIPPVESLGFPASNFVWCQVTSSRCRVASNHMPFVAGSDFDVSGK